MTMTLPTIKTATEPARSGPVLARSPDLPLSLWPTEYPINAVEGAAPHTRVGYSSPHEGGAHFLLCDGAVRFLSENIDFTLYQGLTTRSGSEVLDDF